MKNFIRRGPWLTLILLMAFVIVIEIIMHLYYGYYSSGNVLLPFTMGFIAIIRYWLAFIYLIITIWLIINKRRERFFVFTSLLMIAFGLIPKWNYDNLGSLLALQNANPDKVLVDARSLAQDYPVMTCFGYVNQRYPCEDAVPHDQLPASIQNAYARNVLIMNDYILIEKFGLEGVFRGYVAFRTGIDIWENEPTFIRGDCSHCWKIRIVDGLYWYSANPSSNPVYIDPLK